MEIKSLPCMIRGVPFASNQGEGLRVITEDGSLVMGQSVPTEMDVRARGNRVSITQNSLYKADYYCFRGGLSLFCQRDSAFLVISGKGFVKFGLEQVDFEAGQALDFTDYDGKLTFESPVESKIVRVCFDDGVENE